MHFVDVSDHVDICTHSLRIVVQLAKSIGRYQLSCTIDILNTMHTAASSADY